MPRYNRCMYMAHVCFYVCVRGVLDVVFSVCIVTHGALGAHGPMGSMSVT